MRKLALLLVLALPVMAADHKKHYTVCISGGGQEVCTKPLQKDVAEATAFVLANAPIGGLDYVSITDINKKGKDKPQVQPRPAETVRYPNNS